MEEVGTQWTVVIGARVKMESVARWDWFLCLEGLGEKGKGSVKRQEVVIIE